MSRTKIEKLIFDKLKTSQKVTPTTLDSTNNMYIEYTHDNVSIIVTNSDTSNSLTITIKGAPGFSDYVVSVPKSETHVISNLESAYFKQSDNNLYLDVSANTGTIWAIEDVI